MHGIPAIRLIIPSLFAFAFACAEAAAHTFCASSADDIQSALTASSTNGPRNGEDNIVQIVIGTYATGAATGHEPFVFNSDVQHSLSVLGGYNADCSARTANATATVISGSNQTGAMALFSRVGAITVSDITFEQGHSDIPGAGLAVNWCPLCQPFSGNPVTITHSIFRENMSSDDCGGLFAQSGPLVTVSHSLFADNTSGMTEGGAACLDARGGFTQFYGNTVVQNTAASGAGATGGLLCGQSGPCDIDDNIFWQNSGFGLDLESSGSVLLYNDFGGRTGQAPSLEIGDVSENPNFVDFAGGNYHLSSASPLLALSNVLLDGVDLQGNPYPTGGRQDLGAFEETVYIDGFDGP
jgi:hypothetical protein